MGGTIPVALKLPKEGISNTSLMNEANILQSLNHKNVLLFYGLYSEQGCTYLVVEFLSLGSLASLIEAKYNDLEYLDFIAM
jgi:serine/threonine protein kinase